MGETYERFASAHEMLDYKNMLDEKDRLVWAPFHFLPAGEGTDLDDKSVCRPDSKNRPGNDAPRDRRQTGRKRGAFARRPRPRPQDLVCEIKKSHSRGRRNIEADALSFISKLGHGAALHFPDMPWAKWKYTNHQGIEIERDNLPDFVQAANMTCKVAQGYLKGNLNYELEAGLPEDSLKALENLLAKNCDHDEHIRLAQFSMAIADGKVPGIKEAIPRYIAKGEGSWKHAATGITANDDGFAQPE